jgi:hypothetical protein
MYVLRCRHSNSTLSTHPRGPVPQDVGTPLLSLLQIVNRSIISIAVLENMPPTLGYIKEPPFPH